MRASLSPSKLKNARQRSIFFSISSSNANFVRLHTHNVNTVNNRSRM